jgi:hypothetical protein
MSKYDPLRDYLEKQSRPLISMSFDEIERIIRDKLPPAAIHHRAWWSNNATNNVMTKAWRNAGFKSEQVDMEAGTLVFRRDRPRSSEGSVASEGLPPGRHPLIGWMKGTLMVADGVELTEPADPEWGEVAHGSRSWDDRK